MKRYALSFHRKDLIVGHACTSSGRSLHNLEASKANLKESFLTDNYYENITGQRDCDSLSTSVYNTSCVHFLTNAMNHKHQVTNLWRLVIHTGLVTVASVQTRFSYKHKTHWTFKSSLDTGAYYPLQNILNL